MKASAATWLRLPTWNEITKRDAPIDRGPRVRLANFGAVLGRDASLLLADEREGFIALDLGTREVTSELVMEALGARPELDREPSDGASVDPCEVGRAAFAVRVHERMEDGDPLLPGKHVGHRTLLQARERGAILRLRTSDGATRSVFRASQ